jgi:hypothetical protein
MSRIVIVILIYHRYKPTDLISVFMLNVNTSCNIGLYAAYDSVETLVVPVIATRFSTQ